jgi:hypothetical protein
MSKSRRDKSPTASWTLREVDPASHGSHLWGEGIEVVWEAETEMATNQPLETMPKKKKNHL